MTDDRNEIPERIDRAVRPPAVEPRGTDLPPLPTRERPTEMRDSRRPDADVGTAQAARRSRTERAERAARERAILRNRILIVAAAVVLVVLLAGAAVFAFGHDPVPARVEATKTGGSKTTSSTRLTKGDVTISTPVFARIGGMLIHLPVAPEALTAVMFHQSARGKSYDMTSLVPDVNRAQIFALVKKGAKLPIASSEVGSQTVGSRDGEKILDSVWKGTVVRVLRMNRVGKPASAVDAGAKAGTVVFAPVSGTVTRVRSYKLYSKYPDFEIHIKPDAMTQADLVVIHVSDLLVKPGDWVIGGVTPIAHVRLLSNRMKHQLGEYTGEQGDHTHIQFNKPSASSEPEGS